MLFAFIRWATESRERVMISAAYNMLAGIAKVALRPKLRTIFLSSSDTTDRGHGGLLAGGSNVFSWTALFGALAWWVDTPSECPHATASARAELHQSMAATWAIGCRSAHGGGFPSPPPHHCQICSGGPYRFIFHAGLSCHFIVACPSPSTAFSSSSRA